MFYWNSTPSRNQLRQPTRTTDRSTPPYPWDNNYLRQQIRLLKIFSYLEKMIKLHPLILKIWSDFRVKCRKSTSGHWPRWSWVFNSKSVLIFREKCMQLRPFNQEKDWQPPGVEVTRSLAFQLVPVEASSD
jgi:hypothetical protein